MTRHALRASSRAGFTLLEMLLVVAILGIALGLFGWNLLRAVRQNELREAAYQVISDLRRARTDAQKKGVVSSLIITPGTSAYTLQTEGQAAVNRVLPNRVTITPVSADSNAVNISYQPPYGTLGGVVGALGVSWRLTSPSNPNLNLYVKTVGITGKVMLSGTQN